MCASRLQQDWLAYANQSSRVYTAVERHGPSEFVDNALEDIQILLQCIRIVRRHDAAATELGDVDRHVSNSEGWPGQVRSSRPSTPPITMFGRKRRPSKPMWAMAPSVAIRRGSTSNRSTPSYLNNSAPGSASHFAAVSVSQRNRKDS